ncbi:DUF3352 domain-containing protein [Nocardioides sp. MAHUQ-72]|uniref:DUF3352 domain-containing protein n=1 Tax=unclassified Nocardioides TaxID=2615069 RepID=UPI0036158E1E
MSSTFPPGGPQGPEYLEQGGGRLPSDPSAKSRNGRRGAVVASGAIAGLLLVGGGIWAATWYFGAGAQPAQALPDSTLGYVSIDLDPTGAQKIEAVKMLNKFPAIKEQLGVSTDDDLRERLFDEIQKSGGCEDLDYGDDIKPWLGDRAAVAAIDTGEDTPAPVFVLQVKDEDKADAGLTKIRDCAAGEGGDTSGGWAIDGDWAVIAETDDIAQQVADDAADAPLAEDDVYQNWTDEVGDAGIINMYAAPGAGDYLAENFADLGGMFGGSGYSATCEAVPEGSTDSFCDDTGMDSSTDTLVPSEMTDALKDFKGMAATIRFDDGALELEVAGDPGVTQKQLYASDAGADVVSTLPEDTAAAIGVGFEDGWFADAMDQMSSYYNGEMSAEEMLSQMEDESGLDLPDDAETLAGDAMSLSIGSDFDPETFFNSGDGSGIPVAAKIKGDADGIEGVLDKVRGQMGEEADLFGSDADGDMVAIGPDSDYRSQVLEDGNLGDSDVFKNVVREADQASFLMFVNFDAGDWLVNLAGGDQEATDNLEPLEGLGMSAWQEDDAAHGVLRLTTN